AREFCPKVAYGWEDGSNIVLLWKLNDYVLEGEAKERELARRKALGPQWKRHVQDWGPCHIYSIADTKPCTDWLLEQFASNKGAVASPVYVPALGCANFNTGKLATPFIWDDDPFPYGLWAFNSDIIVIDDKFKTNTGTKRKRKRKMFDDEKMPCTFEDVD